MAHGKTYNEAYAKVDREREYDPVAAIELVKQSQRVKFVESVEVHIRTSLNVRHADEQLRGTITFPRGLGRDVKVAVFARGDAAADAEAAGADYVGAEDLAKQMEEGLTDFDVVIASPDMMPVVGGLGRVLGPIGKMPNPKVGTVTPDVKKAITDAKAGKVEYRTDRQGIVHMTIGKTDFSAEALLENYATLIEEITRAKPSVAKGKYLLTITLSSTMGPGVHVDTSKTHGILEEAAAAGSPAA